jgi:two-component system, chemotaxis family, sensor kinase CheA
MNSADRDVLAEASMLFDPNDAAGRAGLADLFALASVDSTLGDQARCAALEAARLLAGNPTAGLASQIAVLADAVLTEAPAPPPESDRVAVAEFLARAANEGEELSGIVLAMSHGDPSAQADLRRRFHTLKGDAGMLGIGELQAVCHAAEDALITAQPAIDALLAVCDWIGLEVAHLAGGPPPQRGGEEVRSLLARPTPYRQLGELLVDAGAALPESVDAALATQLSNPDRRIGELLVERGAVHASDISAALAHQRGDGRLAPATMRVEVERVDQLADAIGELGIAHAMLGGILGRVDRRTATLMSRIERILRTAQVQADRLRMVPVRPAFQRAERAIREAAGRLGRPIDVTLAGADTELDKAVVERLTDPLLHLVRNAVAHGIEDAENRAKVGKPVAGNVRLTAERREGRVEISVADDGRGLDRERILAVARARSLPVPGADAPDDMVWNLLFLPGFTTTDHVSDLSGRGVGLDVVRSAVGELRGRIAVSTTPGLGTTFSLVLPPTLAAVDGLALSAGGQRFVVPTSSVRACVRPLPSDLRPAAGNGRLLPHQGRMLPWRPLPDLLGIGQLTSLRPQAVVIGDGGRLAALAVDYILGRTQAVLKPVPGLPETAGIAGAAIGSDGRVELVLDPEALLSACDHMPMREAS